MDLRHGGVFGGLERAWFEIPSTLASEANEWGDSWLVTYLPLAVTMGQPLHLRGLPVDPQLLEQAQTLMAIWSDWYPELSPVPVEAERRQSEVPAPARRTATFFSGGVDSFYTILHASDTGSESIDDLFLLHGFDISIPDKAAYGRVLQRYQELRPKLGAEIVPIATNVRETRFDLANWGALSHACLMAGAALQLSTHYSTVLIPASYSQSQVRPHGSHPETDPLLSNSRTTFRQHGLEPERHEKIEYLCRYPFALDNLRVCYQSERGENCCRCRKCVMVMTTLEIYGKLGESAAFTAGPFDLDLVRRTYMGAVTDLYSFVPPLAREHEREDIAVAVETAFRRTARLKAFMLGGLLPRLQRRFMFRPAARLLLRPLYRWLHRLADWLNPRLP